MKAIVYTQYGPPDVLHLKDVDKPTPNDDQVLIKVHAADVTAGDCKIRGFKDVPVAFWLPWRIMLGLRKPKKTILGYEVAGVIESVGNNVTRFNVGDAVFGSTGFGFGAYAEYVCISEKEAIITKPANLTHHEAAGLIFGASASLFFLKKGCIQSGHRVLINGASGALGTAAIQLAKHFGAHVTGICSTKNIELVRSLGADHVIDYTQNDFTKTDQPYDLIFDTVGKISFSQCKPIMTADGHFVQAVFGLTQMLQALWVRLTSRRKIVCAIAMETVDDLQAIKQLAEAGVIKPVIDRRYPMTQAVDAHRYVETGHKVGSVVMTIIADD